MVTTESDSSPWASAKIFISYRREETGYAAGWLFDRLTKHFGRDLVFRDLENIELGENFVQEIKHAVGSCDVLLALIGDQWLTIRDASLRCRLEVPGDYVRLEIEAALQRDVYVIPILVAGAKMPKAESLPPSLADLVTRNALELSPSRFNADADTLIKVLDRRLSGRRSRLWKHSGPLVAASLVLSLALIVSIVLWGGWGGDPPSPSDPTQPATSTLPTSAALPPTALVVPLTTGGVSHLNRVSSNGGRAVQLGNADAAHAPVLSRSRQTVIYLAGTGGASTPRVMAANGDGDRDLFTKPPAGCTNVEHVAWSRANQQLLALVCDDDQGLSKIVLARLDGTYVRTLPTGDNHVDDPAFSHDGRQIAYWANASSQSTRGALFVVAVSGRGTRHPLTAGARDSDPAWSPVDGRLAFSRSTQQPGGRRTSAIYLIPSGGGTPAQLVGGPDTNSKPAWSPDGKQVAYVKASPGADAQLWIVDADGADRRALGASAPTVGTPSWGPR